MTWDDDVKSEHEESYMWGQEDNVETGQELSVATMVPTEQNK